MSEAGVDDSQTTNDEGVAMEFREDSDGEQESSDEDGNYEGTDPYGVDEATFWAAIKEP